MTGRAALRCPGTVNDLGEVVMDRKIARRSYAHSWFILDLPASLPYSFLARYLPLGTPVAIYILFDVLKILRLPRAFRYMYRRVCWHMVVFRIPIFFRCSTWGLQRTSRLLRAFGRVLGVAA